MKPKKQKATIEKFECTTCDGRGYIEQWGDFKGEESKIIQDCKVCEGKGYVMKYLVDKRKLTQNIKLEYNDNY